ncbi:MAG: hypothetical protein MUF00_10950 [Gemmatimonadaceae bacterium]|jgi:hypothetical protein|nr:hypothetical protein [Gemmatimonadaceae bacterium]
MSDGTGQLAKGATVLGTLAWLEGALGPAAARRHLDRALGRHEVASLRAVEATAEVHYAELVALWQAIDGGLRATRPSWAADAGAYSIDSVGQHLYAGILGKRSPNEFLEQSVSLFRLFYRPGNMAVVDSREQFAVLRLEGFDPLTPLFCERQRGGLRAALMAAGGGRCRVRHVRCSLDGDAFCEWELRWALDETVPAG